MTKLSNKFISLHSLVRRVCVVLYTEVRQCSDCPKTSRPHCTGSCCIASG